MTKSKKSSANKAKCDKLNSMPKDKVGERVKYSLAKHGMTQKELASILFDQVKNKNEKDFGNFYRNLNAKISDTNTSRNLQLSDIQKIADVLPDTSVEFILRGGYENEEERIMDNFICGYHEKRDWATAIDTLISIALERNNCKEEFNNGLQNFDDIVSLRKEISDFIEFKVLRIAEEGRKNG